MLRYCCGCCCCCTRQLLNANFVLFFLRQLIKAQFNSIEFNQKWLKKKKCLKTWPDDRTNRQMDDQTNGLSDTFTSKILKIRLKRYSRVYRLPRGIARPRDCSWPGLAVTEVANNFSFCCSTFRRRRRCCVTLVSLTGASSVVLSLCPFARLSNGSYS